jgi:hypothetical protein
MTTPKANRLTARACAMCLAAIHCLAASAADTNQLSKSFDDLENLTL